MFSLRPHANLTHTPTNCSHLRYVPYTIPTRADEEEHRMLVPLIGLRNMFAKKGV